MGTNTIIIDRRKNGKGKSSENKQKFLRRYRHSIKDAIKRQIGEQNISDIGNTGADVSIDRRDISEPTFRHDYETGVRRGVNPGNKHFEKGDIIRSPDSEEEGNGAGDGGDGEDNFGFSISREEFLDLFFEDLELPNMIETNLRHSDDYKWKRAGVSSSGIPTNMDLVRSMKQSLGRRFALRKPHEKELTKLQLELDDILLTREADRTDDQLVRQQELEELILMHVSKVKNIPFIDNIDLRYRVHAKEIVPVTSAVVFCLMDVSGSMGEHEKDLAKRFFTLLYLFLDRNYDRVDIRFIRHHHDAREVDEHEFFHAKDSGGTIVSKVLTEMKLIIDTDYSDGGWNIYAAQASDGDNFDSDVASLQDKMVKQILPKVQYFAYVEVGREGSWRSSHDTSVWTTYEPLHAKSDKMGMAKVTKPSEIYPVFRELFKKAE